MREGTHRPPSAGGSRGAPPERPVAPPDATARPAAPDPPALVVGLERGVAERWTVRALRHLPAALLALGVVLAGSTALALAWYAVARLTYVVHVGLVLHGVSRRGSPSDLGAREAEWDRFRRRVSWLMDNDAAAFVALALVTRGTLHLPVAPWLSMAVGALLCVIGLASKIWATASLPPGSYYWRNFFFPAERVRVSAAGPYRWVSHPMYSVGYAHVYGWALFVGSVHALVAAACAQALMFLLAASVEHRALARE